MKCYRALILDFDGTLADTLEDVAWCMGRAFEHFGRPAPLPSEVRATMGLHLDQALRFLSRDHCCSALPEWVSIYRGIYEAECGHRSLLFPGVAELLQTAKRRGIRMFIASGKGMAALRGHLARLHILSFIDVILAGDSAMHLKPDPQLYRVGISPHLAGIPDQEVLVIGDTETDLQFASDAGLDSCWASYGYGNTDRCLSLKPTHVIKSMYELETLLA